MMCSTDTSNSSLKWVQYRDKCYHASSSNENEYLSWRAADLFCKENGGHLVTMHSRNDIRFILSQVIACFLCSDLILPYHLITYL